MSVRGDIANVAVAAVALAEAQIATGEGGAVAQTGVVEGGWSATVSIEVRRTSGDPQPTPTPDPEVEPQPTPTPDPSVE